LLYCDGEFTAIFAFSAANNRDYMISNFTAKI